MADLTSAVAVSCTVWSGRRDYPAAGLPLPRSESLPGAKGHFVEDWRSPLASDGATLLSLVRPPEDRHNPHTGGSVHMCVEPNCRLIPRECGIGI